MGVLCRSKTLSALSPNNHMQSMLTSSWTKRMSLLYCEMSVLPLYLMSPCMQSIQYESAGRERGKQGCQHTVMRRFLSGEPAIVLRNVVQPASGRPSTSSISYSAYRVNKALLRRDAGFELTPASTVPLSADKSCLSCVWR